MATAKIVLIFPRPQDEAAFEQVYRDVHTPMVEQKLKGLNRFVATRIVSCPWVKRARTESPRCIFWI